MKATERETITDRAGLEFRIWLVAFKEKYGLTHGEVFEILSDAMATEAAFLRRFERHGHYRKKACVD